jgi:hypothetical protein
MIAGDTVAANELGRTEMKYDPRLRYVLIRQTGRDDVWLARDERVRSLIVGLNARYYEVVE